MALSDFGSFSISASSISIGRAGFGSLLHISYNAAWSTPELVRAYSSADAVAGDFPDADSPERIRAGVYFRNNPKPAVMYIGKGTRVPTKILQLTALTPTAFVSSTYTVTVGGHGFAPVDVTWTSDATPTDAEFATAAVAALNAVPGKNFTASGAASPVSITGNTPGAWFYVVVPDRSMLSTKETTADPGTAADIAAIAAANSSWYAIVTDFNSAAYTTPISTWAETHEKLYVIDSVDTQILTATSTGTADPADVAKAAALMNTLYLMHPDASQAASSNWLGRCLPYTPGEETWALKVLVGLTGFQMTDNELANLRSKNANSIRQVDGTIYATLDGKVAAGEYIDVVRVSHWQLDVLRKAVVTLLLNVPKVRMTDGGLQQIGNVVRGALQEGVDNGAYSSFTLTVPEIASLSDDDIANRRATGFEFVAILAAAVHYPVVRGALLTSAA